MVSQIAKLKKIRWPKIKNKIAEETIDVSTFVEELGKIAPNSKEREQYIIDHKRESDYILLQFTLILYPNNDPRIKKGYLDVNEGEFSTELMIEQYEKALRTWNSKNETGVMSFRNYVIRGYIDEEYRRIRRYETQQAGFTEDTVKLAHKIMRLYSINIDAYTENRVKRNVIESAIKSLQAKEKHTEEKYDEVRRYLYENFGVVKVTSLSTPVGNSNDSEVENTIEDFVEDSNAKSEDDIVDELDEKQNYIGAWQFMINQVEDASVKNREWKRRGYTGILVKSLKYEGNKPIEPLEGEPAGQESLYKHLKPMEREIMRMVIDHDFVEYLIDDFPKSLKNLEGIYWNLFREGRLVTNKCLAECIRQKEPVTEATVSNRLNALGVSFAKI